MFVFSPVHFLALHQDFTQKERHIRCHFRKLNTNTLTVSDSVVPSPHRLAIPRWTICSGDHDYQATHEVLKVSAIDTNISTIPWFYFIRDKTLRVDSLCRNRHAVVGRFATYPSIMLVQYIVYLQLMDIPSRCVLTPENFWQHLLELYTAKFKALNACIFALELHPSIPTPKG